MHIPIKILHNYHQIASKRLTFNMMLIFVVSMTATIAVYLSVVRLHSIFATDDSFQTWTFDAANASSYTYDTNLVTVDNGGARSSDTANKLSNPSFSSNTTGWSISSIAPTGWVEVPADASLGTSNFLVMKYEAKCAATSNLNVGLTSPATSINTYNNLTTACTSANSRQVVSLPSGYPIAQIGMSEADTACATVSLGSTTAHLITNTERMAINRNIEGVASNWSGGSVGTGYLFAGHNDTVPLYAVPASSTDTGNYACAYTNTSGDNESPSSCPTNTSSGQSATAGNQKRVHVLSNGAYIWDLAGNIAERSNNQQTYAEHPDVSGQSGVAYRQYNALTSFGIYSYLLLGPVNSTYTTTQGIGSIYHYSNSASSTNSGMAHGGGYNDEGNGGIYSRIMHLDPSIRVDYYGYRCASNALGISQTYGGSTGRNGGGNTIAVGTVTDAKLIQSVNVGDTNSYTLSAVVYDSTSGNVGGTISSSIAELFYNGSAISTTYTSLGSGWWQLSGTITGANESREYGLTIKRGKTVIVDDFTLARNTTYSLYTTTAYNNPSVYRWDSFNDSRTETGYSSIRYQLCTNDGSTCESGNSWQYWDGDSWETASNTTSHVNTAAQLNSTAMNALSTASKKLSVKVIFGFAGSDQPILSSITVGMTVDTTAPTTNASSVTMKKTAAGAALSSNAWTNDAAPYFSWTAGADNDGGVGLRGYCLYLGTDSSGNPATSKGLLGTSPVSTTNSTCQFIVSGASIDLATLSYRGDTWLSSSSSPYYLNVKAVDNAGNVFSGSSAQFQFRFDNTNPSNPAYISLPSDFISTEEATLTWPTSGGDAAADTHSGLAGLQYRIGAAGTWYGDSHTGTQDATDLLSNDGSYTTIENPDFTSITEGVNLIYLRTWDTAGNVTTSYVSGALKVNSTAPSAPQNLQVTPADATTNAYSFTWDDPATYTGDVNNITYCYTINTVPTNLNCTFTSAGANSLSEDAYATQPGSNTLYLVAKDEAGNINYATYASLTFTYSGSAPGIPLNTDIGDISIKSTSNWKLAVSWDAPSNVGAGISSYKVYRSTTDTTCSDSIGSFTQVGSTAGTTYSDTGLSQTEYYYCVKACDSANNCSAASSTVSETPTGKFTEAAGLSSGPSVSGVTTKKAKISWSTDRDSDSKVAFGTKSGSYFEEEPSTSTQTTDHGINLTNLTPGTTYYYKAKWTDEDGNTGSSEEKSFTTEPAPTIKDVTAKNIGLSSAIIEFTSKGASKVKIYYGTTTGFGGVKEVSTSTSETTYTSELTELSDGTKYYYKINAIDSEGSEYEGTILDFETYPRPRISNVRIQEVRGTAQPAVVVTWESNTATSSIVTYYPEGEVTAARDEVAVDLIDGEHRLIIRGLRSETTYILIASGRDEIGNEAVSDTQRFTTATDTRPPLVSNVKVEGTTVPAVSGAGQEARAQLVVSWDTDEPATSQVEFGEGTSTTYQQKTQEDTNLTLNHLVIISDLTPSKVYHLRVISHDKVGNEGTSVDTVTITPKSTDSALDLVVGNLSEIFSFFSVLR